MTSHDVRDVLNLPADGLAPRPSKKQKSSAPRPNLKGLAREVQNLGGDNPIAIVPEVSLYKKRRFASRKPAAKWELRPFKNSARADSSLILRHWRRQDEVVPSQVNGDADTEAADGANEVKEERQSDNNFEDSAFAKYNTEVVVPQYNDDQYSSKLQSDEWTKDETDYLMDLVRSLDLRWPVIWDRYDYSPKPPPGDTDMNGSSTAVIPAPKPRNMEDLKARYYEVAAKMMDVQKPVQYMTRPEWDLHQIMTSFKPEQERKRKEFALNSLSRSKEEAREEESLLLEVKRILARSEKFNEDRRELYNRLDYPHTDQDVSPFKSSAGLQTLLQSLMNVDKVKKRKSLMGAEGVSPAGPVTNGQPASATSEAPQSRRESIAATAAGHRESIGAEKSATTGNKKGQPPPERRKLTQQEEQVYGVSTHERLGSGPMFRYDKVNKLFSHKSGQQQTRINNVLAELEIPGRPTMPTAEVVAEYEKLVGAVTTMLDYRRVRDKTDQDIKIEEAKKAERAKARAVLGFDGANDEPPPPNTTEGGSDEPASSAPDASAAIANGESTEDGAQQPAADVPPADEAAQQQSDAPATNGHATVSVGDDGESSSAAQVPVKEEEGLTKETRPGSRGSRKRSASVLSDKSAKRQRK